MRDLGTYEAQASDNIKLKEKITQLYDQIKRTKDVISTLDSNNDRFLGILTEMI